MNRKLLIGGVALVKGTIRGAGASMAGMCDRLEPVLRETGFLAHPDFETVSLIIRFGTERNEIPEYERINRHKELPVAVVLPMLELRMMDKGRLMEAFGNATLNVLADVARKYGLSTDALGKLRQSVFGH